MKTADDTRSERRLELVSTVLLALAAVATAWASYQAARWHGEQAQAFGPDGYVWSWGQSTFENWQSEFLQVFVFIVLTTFLVHRKSHESPDTDYDTEAALRRIEAKIDQLEQERDKK